jgi:hypothetical protein
MSKYAVRLKQLGAKHTFSELKGMSEGIASTIRREVIGGNDWDNFSNAKKRTGHKG